MDLKEAAHELARLTAFDHAPHCQRVPKANDQTRFDLSCNVCKAAHRVTQLLREQ